MSTFGRSALLVAALSACGPSPGDQGGSGNDDESTTRDPASGDDDSQDASGGGDASGGTSPSTADASSSSASESSSSDGESSSSGGEVFSCGCAATEICVELGVDYCFPDQVPMTHCIETPAACEGIEEPECGTECGWEICEGPSCGGLHKSVCDYVSPGFMCGNNAGFGPCNIFTPSCDKCVSFDGSGSGEYTTTLCSATKPPTVADGEACIVEHGNGYDNCELGSMCVADPPSATTGICRAACVGNPWNASCTDPAMQCVLDGWRFAWCMPT